jgi:hypothetical protein
MGVKTPKRLRGVFFPKNTSKRPFLAQEALMNLFLFFCTFNCKIYPRLLQEHVQKVSQKLTVRIVRLLHLKFKEKFFPLCLAGTVDFDCPWYKNFQLPTLRFCTIIMHIMLGTCVPNLRGRR